MTRQTNRGRSVALEHALKKITRLFPLVLLSLWLAPAVAPLQARDASRTLQDLLKLEAKVEAVAAKVKKLTAKFPIY